MYLLAALLLSLLLSTSANAFVGKLMPNNLPEGGIPCNAMAAMLFFYISPGGPQAGVLSSIIQREWVPNGWDGQDLVDNSNLVALIDGAATQDGKENLVHRLTFLCFLWELGVDEVNTPSKFRTRLGIPQAPP